MATRGIQLEARVQATVRELIYQGVRWEHDLPNGKSWQVFEFQDAEGNPYRWVHQRTSYLASFGHMAMKLQRGDRVTVRAKFGCHSWPYVKSPHHETLDWPDQATYFMRPQILTAPETRRDLLHPWEQRRVRAWTKEAPNG